jgi:hypothetical protein
VDDDLHGDQPAENHRRPQPKRARTSLNRQSSVFLTELTDQPSVTSVLSLAADDLIARHVQTPKIDFGRRIGF